MKEDEVLIGKEIEKTKDLLFDSLEALCSDKKSVMTKACDLLMLELYIHQKNNIISRIVEKSLKGDLKKC